MEEHKKCSKCGISKPLCDFYWRKDKNRYRAECKQCSNECNKQWKKLNPNKVKEHCRNYYKNNQEKCILKSKEYFKDNHEKCLEANREWKKDNYEKCLEYNKLYKIINKEKCLEYGRQYYKNNLDKIKDRELINYEKRSLKRKVWEKDNYEKRYKYITQWKKDNPLKVKKINKKSKTKSRLDIKNRLCHSFSSGLYRSLRGNKNKLSWESLVDYTLQELMQHLENLFTKGMSWNNYGAWHIDHIIPVSLWQFSSYEDREFKQCWALANLQPLWAFDNVSKGNRIK